MTTRPLFARLWSSPLPVRPGKEGSKSGAAGEMYEARLAVRVKFAAVGRVFCLDYRLLLLGRGFQGQVEEHRDRGTSVARAIHSNRLPKYNFHMEARSCPG